MRNEDGIGVPSRPKETPSKNFQALNHLPRDGFKKKIKNTLGRGEVGLFSTCYQGENWENKTMRCFPPSYPNKFTEKFGLPLSLFLSLCSFYSLTVVFYSFGYPQKHILPITLKTFRFY
jgi:hypothetical protein